ncbi:L-threonylcarbamoyladenylate synthase [Psychroflexus sp. ALD_RP9]|uniref:L-threonylcarbamoyladenylate synthase n=1 Tax=Psychroflexus sp. ALD_RP9 TaxID=2777186 RepID=UPI001A90B6E0|nr:L-threonylcarbamoyladenylate synthase [Psychroflexus sp. ALD_RP9]QSS96056.1 threonylcarbamoyl-AMP synthase [Psychroflexus sp. ALD_RP9]
MKTQLTNDVEYCAKLLQNGQNIAIPTETVYGLAGIITNVKALKRIFSLKQRPQNNPLIVHIYELNQLDPLTTHVPKKAKQLAEVFWPGPLSMVFPKSNLVNQVISAGLETVAVRMPNHSLTLALLKAVGTPIAAPSANPFTRISPTQAQHVLTYFNQKIPAILDGGSCQVGLESTIVGFDQEQPIIYRKGGISQESIEEIIGPVQVAKSDSAIKSPGMHLKHYSPTTRLILTEDIAAEIEQQSFHHQKIGVISFSNCNYEKAEVVKVLSKTANLTEAAQQLYQTLHELDQLQLDLIITKFLPNHGLGASINDRLQRAKFQ